jgi:glycerol-3-phosphate dehydrogenase
VNATSPATTPVAALDDPSTIAGDRFDLAVIGGGMLGACAAWEASRRGLRVLLVEAGDFGAATSANSLKIVHGGLRYLQHLDLRRFRESVTERSFWLRAAPHLVEPLPVVFPASGRGLKSLPVLRMGLLLNDLLSFRRNRGVNQDRWIPSGRVVGLDELMRRVPLFESDPPPGAVLFHDALFRFPERLVLSVVEAGARAGALPLNHVRLVRGGPAPEAGIDLELFDEIRGRSFTVTVRAVLNACGSSVDEVAGLLLGSEQKVSPAWSTAINLVVDHQGHDAAFALPARARGPEGGGRQLFVVPWSGRTMIGTGHYVVDGPPPRDAAQREAHKEMDTERFLAEVNAAWPGGGTFDRDDVRLVHWGLLPCEVGSTGGDVRLIRRHRIVEHGPDGLPGAFSLLGVKLTTGRAAARDAVDAVSKALDHRASGDGAGEVRLPHAPDRPLSELRPEVERTAGGHLAPDVADALAQDYGEAALEIAELVQRRPALAERVGGRESPVILAQFVHGVRSERARTAQDLVWRRTSLGPRGLATDSIERRAQEFIDGAA